MPYYEKDSFIYRIIIFFVLISIVIFLSIASVSFFIYSLFKYLIHFFDPGYSALIIGFILLIASGGIYFFMKWVFRPVEIENYFDESDSRRLNSIITDKRYSSFVSSFMLGYMFMKSPDFREKIMEKFKDVMDNKTDPEK